MGAWGYGLFQSDHDLDIVSDLDHEAGIGELEKHAGKEESDGEAGEQKVDPNVEGKENRNDNDNDEKHQIYYSIYASLCSDPEPVRKHLDAGVLAKLLAKKEATMLSPKKFEYPDPGYVFVLLGACAMSLGCTIPKTYKNSMQKVFTCIGLMHEAVQQMNKALNGPNGHQDGVPYHFDSPGLIETANMDKDVPKEANNLGFVPMNVPSPGGMFDFAPKGSNAGLKELKLKYANGMLEARHVQDACGACGVSKGEGTDGALLQCAKCKTRKYCSKDCQNTHWDQHKKVCKKLAPQAGKENADPADTPEA